MSKDDLDKRRDALRTRIDQHETAEAEKAAAATRGSAAGFAVAFRLSTELIAAIIVGGLIGYGLDWLLGTLPWLFILFVLLGFVAGILNVLRSAGLIQPPQVGKRPHEGTDR
ncbi:AtpZ/AtpI family protein [Acuticoccus sp. MNP-M23]|uniref:AtpZ/AtpI family protein n=1 Tax=Acuticoccus sp. MNP-M23 TaxID=3072793 RepID=UPI002814DB2C|nr:AtpZ/AtpI family protein [Acuticoccus sp. MNP-M23]WMS41757.1 AtpZ/AtpI family protein [Acuticoccus sp. MNP-M23]